MANVPTLTRRIPNATILALKRARFELDVANLVMKHLDKLKPSGVLDVLRPCAKSAKGFS